VRILHVGWGYPPQWMGCGPVVYVHTLALAQKHAGDVAVVAVASDRTVDGAPYAPAVENIEGIPYVHLQNRPVKMHDFWNPGREASDPACEQAFAHLLREARPEVVHIHNFVGLSFGIVDVAKEFGARVVTSLHNYFPVCSRDDLFFGDVERCGGPRERSCSNCLGTLEGDDAYRARHGRAVGALDACDVLLAVSRRVAEIYGAQGVRTDHMAVEHIGSVTAERLWADMGRRRVEDARTGARADGPLRVAFFGSPTPRKGVVSFLQAVRQLGAPEQVEAQLYGGLSPQTAAHLEGLVQAMDPAHATRLSLRGGFSHPDLPRMLAGADVAVLPPRWEDNGPQTVLESLAAGVPVVATRLGGIPDFVDDGVNGILVEDGYPEQLAAAIDKLAGDRSLLARLRSGIRPPRTMEEHRVALADHYMA